MTPAAAPVWYGRMALLCGSAVAALRAGRMGALDQWANSALGLALLAVAGGGGWYYHEQEQQKRREVEAELEFIVRLKVEQIVRWRADRLADATVLMGTGFFSEGVWRWMTTPRVELEEAIRDRLDSMLHRDRYQDVALVDTQGQVRLATSGRAAVLDDEELQLLASAVRERRPVLSEPHTGPSAPKPHVSLVVPLHRKAGTESLPVGAVVLMIDAQQFLYPLIWSWPTPTLSAETLLVRRDGRDALFINDIRHRPDSALQLRVPLSQTDVPAVMAVLGHEGVFAGKDYRGVKVLSILRAVPDSPWFMVAKIDESEALEQWKTHAVLIVAVILSLALALAAAASVVRQQRSKYRALSGFASALRESEELFRSAMQFSTVGMALVAPDGRWLEVNDAVCEVLGYSRDELLATNFQALTHPDDLESDLEQVRAMLEFRIKSYQMEKRYLHKTGSTVWALLGVSLAHHADGTARHFISQIQDITQRKRVEDEIRMLNEDLEQRVAERTEQLARSESRMRQLLANTPAVIWASRAEGDYARIFVSENVREVLGYEPEDFISRPGFWASRIHPDDRLRLFAQLPGEIATGEMTHEYRIRHADGQWRWVRSDATVVRNATGRPEQLVGYCIDVTNRKAAETALAESRQHQAALLDGIPDIAWLKDTESRYIMVNKHFALFCGRKEDELPGLSDLDLWPRERAELYRADDAEVMRSARLKRIEEHIAAPGGELIWVETIKVPFFAEGGRVAGTAGVARDITERKQMREALEHLSRMKSEFMANITHELRTPLNSVIGFAELLKDRVPGPLNEKQVGFVADIHESGLQMLKLVEGILAMSRVDAGGVEPEREPVDIGAALQERLAAHRRAAEARGVTMGMEVAPDTGSVELDPQGLRHILDALLDNAVKFNREAGTVMVSAHRADGALEIAVADTGIGIAPADLLKLFQPLVQVDSALVRRYAGIGLGLALARRIAEQQGGVIEVISESGKGSTFTLRLPIREAQ